MAQQQLDQDEESSAQSISPALAQLRLDQDKATPGVLTTLAQHKLDPEEIRIYLKRGKDLIANGDLAAARIVLQRAADANDAESALALGATYDPVVLRELKVHGLMADEAMARAWYEKAKELGSAMALRRLELLAKGTR